MGRSVHALVFLSLLLVCSVTMTASSKYVSDEELGLSLATAKKLKHDHHRHSGFSEAECPDACQYRCSKTQYKKPCLFFCQKCCFKCKCVPPGTYANKEVCPCYNNWKTKEGGPKCP